MVAPPVAAAPPLAAAEPAADDPAADVAAALVAAALLLVDELVPDEQAASARPAAASPAMSFKLRARRTLFSSSSLHVTPDGGRNRSTRPTGMVGGPNIDRTLPAGSGQGECRRRSVTESCRKLGVSSECRRKSSYVAATTPQVPPFGRTPLRRVIAEGHRMVVVADRPTPYHPRRISPADSAVCANTRALSVSSHLRQIAAWWPGGRTAEQQSCQQVPIQARPPSMPEVENDHVQPHCIRLRRAGAETAPRLGLPRRRRNVVVGRAPHHRRADLLLSVRPRAGHRPGAGVARGLQ